MKRTTNRAPGGDENQRPATFNVNPDAQNPFLFEWAFDFFSNRHVTGIETMYPAVKIIF